jgi:toxin-antitoxin system PIN domain toxin
MTSFFPDLNVWLAIADTTHLHTRQALAWLGEVPPDGVVILSRYTQLGILRLPTNRSVMGLETPTIEQAWSVVDRLLEDPRIEFHPEPAELDPAFRLVTSHLDDRPASKWIGDCFLVACAYVTQSTLVTFDQGLLAFSRQHGYSAIVPE